VSRDSEEMDSAVKTVKFLFKNGAIWNDLDSNGETLGCIAHRLGLKELYELCVDAGVRAEILLSRLVLQPPSAWAKIYMR
jgi:protein arginine N-methyltransferase 2